ncbi:MAG: bifunctional diguanylate cyclase/phosphodiesterase [Massilia sp.]|nr:bifunctional diguanylate cyclase/phosphodiesterase [Massilia sp.]
MPASEMSPHAAFLVDGAGAIVTWNPGCEALFGIQAISTLNHLIGTLLSDASAAEVAFRWPSLQAAGESLHLQVQLARPAGNAAAATEGELTLAPQTGADGRFSGCVALFSPATDYSEAAQIGSMHLRAVVNVLPGMFYVLREDNTFVLWNKPLEAATGYSSEEMLTARALDMFELIEKPKVEEKMRQVFERGEPTFIEATLLDKDGHGAPYVLTGARIECSGKHYLCGMGLDISLRHQQEEQLRLRERALHAASNAIVITRCSGRDNPIEYVNPAFERITGFRLEEAVGRDSRFMAAPGMDVEARALLRQAIDERRELNVTLRNQRKNGELFWNDLTITPVADEKGRVTHFIGVINDVTVLKQRTAHLEHEVNHDALTGLANRTLLWDRLEQAIHMAQRNKSLVATVLMDLNGFKKINDTLGHEAGDEVLASVAKRLLSSVRESDTVARLSGDEFVLVLVNQPSLRFTLRMVQRLRQCMTLPVVFDSTEIEVGASIGVSVFPHDGNTAFELVRAADVAMYHAKANRKNDVHFFSSDMKTTSEAKQRFEDSMRGAVEKNELFLMFQPKICLQSGRIRGFEALLRWNHPEQGLLLPASFLPEAEENGMIVPFGALVLEQACTFLQRLAKAGFADLPVSINVSQREYSTPHFVERTADVLALFGLAPSCLEVELREEALVSNHLLGAEVVAQLSKLGVLRSVDAFGHGVSDLNYLQTLPLSHLKLDKVAVHQISPQTRTGPMAKCLIDIGHNMNLSVIAECVETRAQMDFLRTNGCDQMQGLYFKEPLSAEAAEQFLVAASA